MRDISKNKYVIAANNAKCFNNDFADTLPKKAIDDNEFRSLIRDLLAQFGFCINFNGYKYLARLIELYLMEDDYCETKAIEKLATHYGEYPQCITADINNVITRNADFARQAARVLCVSENCIMSNITDTVEAVAAIFYVYYSHSFDCKTHCDLEPTDINFLQVIDYVQRANKKN